MNPWKSIWRAPSNSGWGCVHISAFNVGPEGWQPDNGPQCLVSLLVDYRWEGGFGCTLWAIRKAVTATTSNYLGCTAVLGTP
ncbi:hypothetical protein FA13DRAFT_1737049 [Coprinellus micaceus]|uniref:Uncharacterized protein n=1 Tax=Coprinellus micaceus TaxID=71717 RepID=A0A4Y7SYY8_COPMI|nr:hypothetical protein FA13DRAFT_1737049 [Coprinellus micaceus]